MIREAINAKQHSATYMPKFILEEDSKRYTNNKRKTLSSTEAYIFKEHTWR